MCPLEPDCENSRQVAPITIEHPIIQAPMAGASSPAMAAAAGNAGALGSLGCAMFEPEKTISEVAAARAASNRSLNLNFFVHEAPTTDVVRNASAVQRLQHWYDDIDAGPVAAPKEGHFPFDEDMCEAVLKASPKVASFHFGLPDDSLVQRLKDEGIVILSSATSVAEAKWLEERGADAIIAQGYEAGGHNGWFLPRNGADVSGTMALVPRIVDAVSVPVIAAGGISDGRGIAAALMLGAAGVQIGTAFLATPEAVISEAHKAALLSATGDDTMYSAAFSGRSARTVVNDYAREMEAVTDWPDFPLMNAATGPIRAASAKAGKPDAIALWSGQAVGLMREESTAEVVHRLVAETEQVLSRA